MGFLSQETFSSFLVNEQVSIDWFAFNMRAWVAYILELLSKALEASCFNLSIFRVT